MLEHGAYTLLIDACYDREKFPTLDDAIDWCWARSDDELAAVHFVLKKFFTLIDGFYIQNRIREEIDQYHANALTNKEIALNREAKKREAKARTVHEPITDEHERAPKQEPLTINQETITSKEIITPQAAPSKELAKPVKKSTRLPDNWEPTQDYWDAAVLIGNELNIDMRPRLKQIAHKFKDYWIAKSGKDATKADWLATWRNWIRREAENAKGGIGTTGKKSYGEQRAELFDGLTDYNKATNF
jgi:uncharacterized protein YdaU (DUF1376 family)